MRRGIIVNLKRFKFLDYVTHNKIFILLCVLFVTGLTLGAIFVSKNSWLSKNVQMLFKGFVSVHIKDNFFKKFFICITHYLIILVIYFLSGASMLGIAVTPFVTLWQGILTGGIISFLYSALGLSGIAFNAIILIPPLSVFSVCCFFAANRAIDFSFNIAKLTMPKSRPTNLHDTFKNYCGRYLIFVGVTVICVLLEIILNLLFLKHFKF